MAHAVRHPVRTARHGERSPRDALGPRRLIALGVLGAAAAALLATLALAVGTERLGHDFRASYLEAAEATRASGSPYLPVDEPVPAGLEPYVYPPTLALALVPLTGISADVAAASAVAISLAALLAALALLGVRDPLCYAALVVWAPTWNALEMANVSAALALTLALAWRFREHSWKAALPLGLTLATKLFLWPVLVWSAATGRARTALGAIGIGLAVTVAAWWSVGFETLLTYTDQLARIPMEDSYSIPAVVTAFQGSTSLGSALALLIAGGSLLLTVRFGRQGDDLRALTCAIAASLSLTPVVWQHYLVLLAVPLAIARPRFSALWLVPVALWLSPRAGHGEGVEVVLPLAVTLVVIGAIIVRPAQTETGEVPGTSIAR